MLDTQLKDIQKQLQKERQGAENERRLREQLLSFCLMVVQSERRNRL